MIAVIVAGGVAMLASLFGTHPFIRWLTKKEYGQFIRQDGPTAHYTKRGTPTMGGVVMILAAILGMGAAFYVAGRLPSASVWLALFLTVGLGFVGFLDDFMKISQQRSLGLKARWKIVGQGAVGITFSVLALQFPNARFRTPASTHISFTRDLSLDLAAWGIGIGLVLFVLWSNFLITAWSNAVNLTDGLDGLATGASMLAFGAYVFIAMWQAEQSCQVLSQVGTGCYEIRDPQDLSIFAAAFVGALLGFLWWNASPAQIFMGDTGALALGGAFAALSILTRTQFLAAILGGLFVLVVLSDVIQIGSFKLTGKRVFKMAPLHHHFELSGWKEVTIVIRFWIIAALFVAAGVAIFYAEWFTR